MSKKTIRIYHPAASPQELARRTEERRRRDRVSELEQGFTFRPYGRQGYIYYREGGNVLELAWEIAGPDDRDIIVFLRGLQRWAIPAEDPVDHEKQVALNLALREWLQRNRVRAIFDEGE
jgi:hypothetical protein